jgi:hypothetical protein
MPLIAKPRTTTNVIDFRCAGEAVVRLHSSGLANRLARRWAARRTRLGRRRFPVRASDAHTSESPHVQEHKSAWLTAA